MLAIFIGENRSMGLRHGMVYEIEMTTRPSGQVDVWWKPQRSRDRRYCLYRNADAFQANWDVDQLKCKLLRLTTMYGHDAVADAIHKLGETYGSR